MRGHTLTVADGMCETPVRGMIGNSLWGGIIDDNSTTHGAAAFGTFSKALADWYVPNYSPCPTGNSGNLIWSGIGGMAGGHPLLQSGTWSMSPFGANYDRMWYEYFGGTTSIGVTIYTVNGQQLVVNTGDLVEAFQQWQNSGSTNFTVWDKTTGVIGTHVQNLPAGDWDGTSAEAISEAPVDGSNNQWHLRTHQSVYFPYMTAVTPSGNHFMGDLPYDGAYMYGKDTGVYMEGPTYGLTNAQSFTD